VVSTPVFRKKDGSLPDPEPVFLSSLIAPDIKRVADAAPQGFGRALTSYLSDPAPTSGRLDLRTRRAVIVGDPRQLEPISQVPIAVQEKLRVLSRLPPHWLPASISAQGLADRRSVLGTQVATDDEPVWVGTPLRVHRRCEHPMFEMINDLAYGGLMVYGTAEQRYHKPALDPSFSKRPSARPRQAERAG
jgi:hypothetical protein